MSDGIVKGIVAVVIGLLILGPPLIPCGILWWMLHPAGFWEMLVMVLILTIIYVVLTVIWFILIVIIAAIFD